MTSRERSRRTAGLAVISFVGALCVLAGLYLWLGVAAVLITAGLALCALGLLAQV